MKLFALFVLAVITTSSGFIGAAGSAFAQEVEIETSADDHGGQFFGEGVLRVIVTDPDADNDSVLEQIQVEIEAEPDQGSGASTTISVPETDDGSGRFEFFLTHVTANAVLPGDLNPINNAGVEGDGACIADCAPIVTFGTGGDLNIDSDLYEEVEFAIIVDDAEVEVNYEETPASIQLDRNSYGTTSFVYISVVDQDANLNPRDNDEFTVDPDAVPNSDLLVLDGGTIEDAVVFRETGDNTGVFEGRYRLGISILASEEVLSLTLFDKANYGATLNEPENDSNFSDEISFIIGNTDGTIGVGGQQTVTWDPTLDTDKDEYLLGDSVHVTVVDNDANSNSGAIDSIQLRISSGESEIEVTATETGANTGIFEASFQLAEETDAELNIISSGGSATVTYTDERPADYSDKIQAGESPEKDFVIEIDVQLPVRTGTDSTGMTAPMATDVIGGTGPYAAGDSITLSTTIVNNNEHVQQFVVLVEVRDGEGVTVYLASQSGTLESNGSTDIGVLWQPDTAGEFEVRTFAITNIGIGAELLSLPAASTITVI